MNRVRALSAPARCSRQHRRALASAGTLPFGSSEEYEAVAIAGMCGPSARGAVPVLLHRFERADAQLQALIRRALLSIDPPAEPVSR